MVCHVALRACSDEGCFLGYIRQSDADAIALIYDSDSPLEARWEGVRKTDRWRNGMITVFIERD